jgi:hypothetical protein
MSADIVSTVMLMIAARTQQSVQIAVMRKSHQMEASMLQMLDDVTAKSAPAPAGQGQSIDKRA